MWGKEINDDAGRNAEGEREWEMGGRPVRVSKKERGILWGSTRTGGGGGVQKGDPGTTRFHRHPGPGTPGGGSVSVPGENRGWCMAGLAMNNVFSL
jgi:hypothetical protein